MPEAVLSDFVVFRSDTGNIRAVPTIRGEGVPEEHRMRDDETFAVVIEQVSSPEVAIWKAALSCHEESFQALETMLNLYLEKIDWDREDALEPERVDEALVNLEYFRLEGLRGCEAIGLATAKEWQSADDQPESPPSQEIPGQLNLLSPQTP